MKQLFKAFFVAVAVALLCAVLAVCAFAEVYTGNCGAEGDNVTYSLDTETGVLTITGSGEMADYDYDGTPWNEQRNVIKTVVISNGITSIGDRLFNYCFALESISIPDSITRIGDSAFFSCSSLKQVIIPTGVTEIPHQAFTGCNSITEVFLHSKIENIGSRAFAACDKLVSIDVDEQNTNYCDVDGVVFTKDMQAIIAYPAGIDAMHYDIPESVVEILDSAFEGCLFESVGIPNSVVYIDWWAFMGCTELVSIRIPESVAYLDSDAFHDCSKLKTIDVDESNEKYCDIDGVVFTKDKKTLIRYPEGGSEIYEIPNGVIYIGEGAFGSCDGLESVTLPESLKEIGVNAFNNCSNITDITIPNGVMFIRAYAFWRCNELKSITIPNSVKFIGDDIFYSCDNLESIKIYRNSYADVYFSEEDYIKVYLEDSTITSNGDFKYRINDDEESVTITWYNGDAEDVVISSEIDGYSVTSIDDYAFYECESIKNITIPDTVTSIGKYAFYNCDSIESITIGKNVTSISEEAFNGWFTVYLYKNSVADEYFDESYRKIYLDVDPESDFTYEINEDGETVTITGHSSPDNYIIIPSTIAGYSVTAIGDGAFLENYNIENVKLPEGVVSIGDFAFSACGSLESINIPNGVEYIGAWAFEGCWSIGKIVIPASVKRIGVNSFRDSTIDIEIDNNNENYCIVDGVIFTKDMKTLVIHLGYEFNDWEEYSYSVPEGVETIEDYAFCAVSFLENVYIPDSVITIGDFAFSNSGISNLSLSNNIVSIGEYAFRGCNFEKIIIPDSVTSIGKSAFYGCRSLKSVVIGKGVKEIAEKMFYECYCLESVAVGENIESIGSSAFDGCYSLTNFTIPNSVTSIGEEAFVWSGLTSINIPHSVDHIGDFAFGGCSNLVAIKVDENNETYCDIDGVLFLKDKKTLLVYPGGGGPNYTVPDGVVSIGMGAFVECSKLESVIISDSVKDIGYGAFSECGAISIVLGNNVETIGEAAFGMSENLKNIVIPKSVTSIDGYAFDYCIGLESVTFETKDAIIGDEAFDGCDSLTTIYCYRDSTADIYFDDELYTKIYLVEGDNVYATESDFDYFVNGTTVTITKYKGNGGKIIVPSFIEGCTVYSIGPNAFASFEELVSVVLPDGVEVIGDYAFSNCNNLSSINIPDSVRSIGNSAFTGCGLMKVVIPDSVSVIGGSAFSTSKVQIINIGKGVTSIGDYAFTRCQNLKTINVDENNKNYCDVDGVLYTKDKKTLVAYPENGSVIYTIPDYVTSIGDWAFSYNKKIESLTIPRSVEYIGLESLFRTSELAEIWVYRDSYAHSFLLENGYSEYITIKYIEVYSSESVEIEYNEGIFEEGVEIKITEIDEDVLGNFWITNENGEAPETIGFDITFELDGEKVQPDGYVTVRIKVPQGFNGKNCRVYYLPQDGSFYDVIPVLAEFIDGYMVFQTDHFSMYVIADMSVCEPGDVNSDGEIDTKDAVLLAQYLAKWSVVIDEGAADCNADGAVDTKDAVLLAQYLAKWDVTLG